jgi:predicted Zn finger-like uncharacterized protein
VKFLCEQCKAKYQIADEKAAGKTVRMKCRKCGHLIEVRGVVDGAAGPERVSTAPDAVAGRQAPATQRMGAIRPAATSFATMKPADKPGGALAGALKSALQRDDEVSAPVDMSDLSPSDEWYVAINGVPVGPIRIAEVRRKAAIGAVTEESLCWQEGLEEWRPLRSFPDLAAIVREAFTSNRSSMTPAPPEARGPSVVPPQVRASARPATSAAVPPRAPPTRTAPTSPAAPVARSNVVPITSRLATAEKLAEEPAVARPVVDPPIAPAQPIRPSVVPDPFAPPARPLPAPAPSPFHPAAAPRVEVVPAAAATPSMGVPRDLAIPARKGPPWMAIAMVAAAIAFGVTVGLAFVIRPPPPPASVVVQVPAMPTVGGAVVPTGTAAAIATTEPVAPATSASSATPRSALGVPVKTTTASAATPSAPAASASATTPPHGPLDLGGLRTGAVAPTDDPGSSSEAPHAAGQCITGSQVQQVIGQHRVALQRACWERIASQKPSANVTVSLTVGADGSAQGVSASGDDLTVAKCIEGDVRGWRFPAMGCSQPTSIPFHFVRQ